jgi:hypothetical protein
LPPASYGSSVRARQILTFSRNEGAITLQCYVDVAPARISVVGATALGQRVLSVTWDEQGLRSERTLGGPPGAQALADLQLATWPLAALQAAVAGGPWRIDEPRPGTRQVWREGRVYAEIHYAGASPWEGRSWFVSFEHRYTLDIQSRLSP